MDCSATHSLPDPGDWHRRLRLGQRHDHLLSCALPFRRISSGRNSFGTDSSSIWAHILCRCPGTCHHPRFRRYWRQVGFVHIRLHLDPTVANSICSLQVWKDLEDEKQVRKTWSGSLNWHASSDVGSVTSQRILVDVMWYRFMFDILH